MVKFIVTVRLVEKRVKSHLGRVMEAKVINERSIPGTSLRTVAMK